MASATSVPLTPSIPSWSTIFSTTQKWVQRNAGMAVTYAAVWAITTWLVNVFIMVVVYDGWSKASPGGLGTGYGNVLLGSAIWGTASAIVSSLLPGWRSRDTASSASHIVRRGPNHELLAAIALGAFLAPWLGLVVPLCGVVILASRVSLIGYWLTLLLLRTCVAANAAVPRRLSRLMSAGISPLTFLSTIAYGLLVGWLVVTAMSWLPPLPGVGLLAPYEWVLVVVACVFALQLRRRSGSGGSGHAAALVLLVGIFLSWITTVPIAADDGGWQESGGTLQGLLQNPGFYSALLFGLPGALASAIGALAGKAAVDAFGKNLPRIEDALRAQLEQAAKQAGLLGQPVSDVAKWIMDMPSDSRAKFGEKLLLSAMPDLAKQLAFRFGQTSDAAVIMKVGKDGVKFVKGADVIADIAKKDYYLALAHAAELGVAIGAEIPGISVVAKPLKEALTATELMALATGSSPEDVNAAKRAGAREAIESVYKTATVDGLDEAVGQYVDMVSREVTDTWSAFKDIVAISHGRTPN